MKIKDNSKFVEILLLTCICQLTYACRTTALLGSALWFKIILRWQYVHTYKQYGLIAASKLVWKATKRRP